MDKHCSVVEMFHYPFDRSFHPGMSRTLLRLATDFRMDNRIVPWDELTGSDTIMNELAHQLRRSGWPERTYEEVRKELLRLRARWKNVVEPKSETFRRTAELLPFDDAAPGSGGMMISSSSSLSSVHKDGLFAAVLLKVSLFGTTTFFHLSCNLRSSLRTSS